MDLQIIFKDVQKVDIDLKVICKVLKIIFSNTGNNLNKVRLILTSDNYLKEINIRFLQHNYYTDVITFTEKKKNKIGGDIYISIDRVKENSLVYSNGNFIEELYRIIIHGFLHLVGYKDNTDVLRQEMGKKEDYYLEKLKSIIE